MTEEFCEHSGVKLDSKDGWLHWDKSRPEKWKRILLKRSDGYVQIGVRTDTGWALDVDYISDHNHSHYRTSYPILDYLEWMPLPNPPKENKK